VRENQVSALADRSLMCRKKITEDIINHIFVKNNTMLRKFRVTNFKGFENTFEYDLTDVKGYEFNKSSVKNGVVNHSIIYGRNGSGKSNLAWAIFDILEHLTEKQRSEHIYKNYLNANSQSPYADFYYEFGIDSNIVIYEYRKSDYKNILNERLWVNNEEVVCFDRSDLSLTKINLSGAETLNRKVENPELSILKYIRNNAVLDENTTNKIFLSFLNFIDRMLFFRALSDRIYLSVDHPTKNVLEDIIQRNNVNDLERFLNEAGVDCKLSVVKELDGNSLVFNFDKRKVPFGQVASTGTKALTLFYYWYQEIREKGGVSLLFIDEFDAFYHHSLSRIMIEKLKQTSVQFILTTHNTSIISNDILRPDCYFLMSKTEIKSLANSTLKELREAHNIEKMYRSGGFA